MYALVCFDIDGVLTDGKLMVNEQGLESKRLDFHDIDAIHQFHRDGMIIAAITAEATQITHYFETRFPWHHFHRGARDKATILAAILDHENIVAERCIYMGDGLADVSALKLAGLGVCPSNALAVAKATSDLQLHKPGGAGAIAELYQWLQQQ